MTDTQGDLLVSDVITGKTLWSQENGPQVRSLIQWQHNMLTDCRGRYVFTTNDLDVPHQGWTVKHRNLSSVERIILSNDGRSALSLHQDGGLWRWKLDGVEKKELVGHGNNLVCAFGRSGFVTDWYVKRFPMSRSKWGFCVMELLGEKWATDVRFGEEGQFPPLDADLTPDGRLAALAYNDGIHIWDIVARRLVRIIQSHYGKPQEVSLTLDGAKVRARFRNKAQSSDTGWYVYDLRTGKCIGEPVEHLGSFAPRVYGPEIPIAIKMDSNKRIIRAITSDGKYVARFTGTAPVTCISSLRPDGHFLCGTSEGEVYCLQLVNFPEFSSKVRAIRRFRFHLADVSTTLPASRRAEALAGEAEKNATGICPWCGDWIEDSSFSVGDIKECSTCSKRVQVELARKPNV